MRSASRSELRGWCLCGSAIQWADADFHGFVHAAHKAGYRAKSLIQQRFLAEPSDVLVGSAPCSYDRFAGFAGFVHSCPGVARRQKADINQGHTTHYGRIHELCYADRFAAYIKLEGNFCNGCAATVSLVSNLGSRRTRLWPCVFIRGAECQSVAWFHTAGDRSRAYPSGWGDGQRTHGKVEFLGRPGLSNAIGVVHWFNWVCIVRVPISPFAVGVPCKSGGDKCLLTFHIWTPPQAQETDRVRTVGYSACSRISGI